MTNAEVISLLRNSIKEVTSDSIYTNRFLYNTLRVNALLLLERNKHKLSNLNIFTTEDLETEEVNLLGTCVNMQCMGCRVKLPILETMLGPLYKFITSADMSQHWKVVNALSFKRKANLKSNTNFAYLDGEYLYFKDCPPCLRISYVKDSLADESGETCSRLEDKFLLPEYLISVAIDMSLQKLGLSLQKPQDHIAQKNTNS